MKPLAIILLLSACGMPDANSVNPPCKADSDCAEFGDEFAGRRCIEERCVADLCGNGTLDDGEACDDGNLVAGDGCTAACFEAACGDSILREGLSAGQVGFEACDDGNAIDADDCTNACTLPRCGDGVVQAGEACDDGNETDDDACNNACRSASCGDGVLQDGEACDDGNATDTDGCRNECIPAQCGDGVVRADLTAEQEGYEACDDGNESDDDNCSNACRNPGCGDGVIQDGEGCDDGNIIGTDACTSVCQPARCGDGFTQDGEEQCDDGNEVDEDACLNACQSARCGDGVLRGDLGSQHENAEECDGTEGCAEHCRVLPVELAVGGNSACVRMADGGVRCWGANDLGQLGNPELLAAFSAEPVSVTGIDAATSLTVGESVACAVQRGGVHCWGRDDASLVEGSSIGHEATGNAAIRTISRITQASRVVAGEARICAIYRTGRGFPKLSCWGSGWLGNGQQSGSVGPVQVGFGLGRSFVALSNVTAVAVGDDHSCAITEVLRGSNQTYCWGTDTMGQLGNGGNDQPRPASASAVNPERISNDLLGFSTLKASGSGTCAITTSGADLYCWGGNRNGQLGLPVSASSTAPSRVDIGIGMDVIAFDLGIGGHGCAAEQRDAGGLVCWGSNSNQQLGHQAGGDWQATTAVEGISGTLQIGTGEGHSCVLQADHRVRCFGANDRGQLGIGAVGADFGANRDAVVGIGGP